MNLGQVDALINVPVSQRTFMKDFNMKDMHAYFDISYEGQGNLVQADNNATYMFSKICKWNLSKIEILLTALPTVFYYIFVLTFI